MDTKERKKPVRKVFGRVQWVDVGAGRFRFELTQSGLRVRRKGARAGDALLLPFDRLTGGAGHEWVDGWVAVKFAVTDKGVEVRRGGSVRVQVVPFAELANASRKQPLLFADLTEGSGNGAKSGF